MTDAISTQKRTRYYGFTGVIEPLSATRIAAAFNLAVIDGYDEIYLCLSSPGGYVADGIFLYNHIRSVPAKVTIHNTGTVASIAAAVYVAADVRHCSKHGVFMIHPTEMPAHAKMRAEQLNSSLAAAMAEDQRTENILSERARIPDALLQERRFKEVYITPEKAVEFTLAHKVVEFSLPHGNEMLQI